MKKIITIIGFVMLFTIPCYVAQASGEGLVAEYSFNEGSGITAADSSLNGNNAILVNGPVWVDGKLGKGLSFDSFNDYVDGASPAVLDNLPSLSVSAWIKPKGLGSASLGTIAAKAFTRDTFGNVYEGWSFNLVPGGISFVVDYGTTDLQVKSANIISLNEWQYMTVTWDGTPNASGVKIYKNGVEVSYQTQISGVGLRINDSSRSFTIGNNRSLNATFDGVIDEVKIYNRALIGSEIIAMYGSIPGIPPSLPLNGVCGSSNLQSFVSPPTTSLCTVGTASTVAKNTSSWLWVCAGANGGTTASCQANMIPPPPGTDTTPPLISTPVVSSITSSGATLSWITNEAADTQVEYGVTSSYGLQTPLDTSLSTSHAQSLSGLNVNTFYNFRVKSKDQSGNISMSPNAIFTTSSATPPVGSSTDPDAFSPPVVDEKIVNVNPHEHPPVELAGSETKLSTAVDIVPNFAAVPTIISKQSGNWFSAATWVGGRVPNTEDVVKIATNHTVVYDGMSDVALAALGVEGTLTFDVNVNTRLKVGTILVYRTGKLIVGTQDNPVPGTRKAEIIIANRALATLAPDAQTKAFDPLQFGTGIISFGEVIMHGEKKDPTWVRLAKEPRAGQNTILLESAPSAWKVGDKLVLPDTRQTPIEFYGSLALPKKIALQLEELTIAAVSGATITLTAPLRFDHLAGRDTEGALVALPHVGNVTRNIVVRSESPNGVRGHTFFTERARIDIRYAAFENLGRTTAEPLDSTVITEGIVTKVGINQIGRYPIHFHHLMGPRNSSNKGYQYAFIGNSVVDARKWGVAVHDSHFGLVSKNVIYDAQGAGILTEQGNERENVFDKNFIVKIGDILADPYNPIYGGVSGDGRALGFADFGWEGSGLWFTGNDSYVQNNVVANAAYSGLMYNARPRGFADNTPVVPKFRGADIASPSEWIDYLAIRQPAPEVRNSINTEVYASVVGIWVSFAGSVGTIKNSLLWNIKQQGVYTGRNNFVTYDGLTLVSNQKISNQAHFHMTNTGLNFGSNVYNSGKITVRNAKVEGFAVGVILPGNIADNLPQPSPLPPVTVIDNVYLRNYVNVVEASPRTAKYTLLRDVTFVQNEWPLAERNGLPPGFPTESTAMVSTLEDAHESFAHVALPSQTYIYNYNKIPGNNFEFFFPEQAPGYVMPLRLGQDGLETTDANCPTQGLTNQECWARHQVATLGKVATCSDTTTRPWFRGFTCPITTSATFESILANIPSVPVSPPVPIPIPPTPIVPPVTPPEIPPVPPPTPFIPPSGLIADAIQKLKPGEWLELPGTSLQTPVLTNACLVPGMSPADYGTPHSSCGPQHVTDFSGGAFDTKRNQLIIYGGGHAGYSGNELYVFDVPTAKWSRITDPTPPSDTSPVSVHSYDQLEYLPDQDAFFTAGGSRYGDGGAIPNTWLYDLTKRGQNGWKQVRPMPGQCCSFVEYNLPTGYDPVSHKVVMRAKTQAGTYDPALNIWTVTAQNLMYGVHSITGDIDYKHRKFVWLGGQSIFILSVAPDGALSNENALVTSGANEIEKCYSPGFVFDPKIDRFTAWCSGGDVYTLNLDTNAWTKHTPTGGTPPPYISSGYSETYGRFRYMPAYNAYIVFPQDITKNVFIYKLSDGLGTAPAVVVATAPNPSTVAVSGGGGGSMSHETPPITTPLLSTTQLTPSQASARILSSTLSQGARSEEARRLQQFLNSQGFVVSSSGLGSISNETTFFGIATAEAVKKFQLFHGIIKPEGDMSGAGKVGKLTLAKIQSLQGVDTPSVMSASALATPTSASVGTSSDCTDTVSLITQSVGYKSKGKNVRTLQCMLIRLKYMEPGNVTGFYGLKTLKVVKNLQCAESITACSEKAPGYGSVGPKTIRFLNSLVLPSAT